MQTAVLLLLVEDDSDVRSVLEATLHDAGFDLTVAENGAEALAILDAQSSAIRGLITDVNLGRGPNGWDIARHARERALDLPVVYMSGASGGDWASQGVPNSTLVAKPFAPAQIVAAISALLNITDSHRP